MYTDPRGGHNRKVFDVDFFKKWSPNMAYVLGLIFSDGAIEDVRKSTRTCYMQISSIDKSLVEQVRKVMLSNHNIYIEEPKLSNFSGKFYMTSKAYTLRIGSKELFQSLINRGVTPRKSLRLRFPTLPSRYLSFFTRGYFDGDGCISIYKHKNPRRKTPTVQVVFTSGTRSFLKILSEKFSRILKTSEKNISWGHKGAYDLRYKSREAMKVLDYIYRSIDKAPFLDRKYMKYKEAKDLYQLLNTQKDSLFLASLRGPQT